MGGKGGGTRRPTSSFSTCPGARGRSSFACFFAKTGNTCSAQLSAQKAKDLRATSPNRLARLAFIVTRRLLSRAAWQQAQLHKNRIPQWCLVIGRAPHETKCLVESNGGMQRRYSVQLHSRVADRACLLDHSFRQPPAKVFTPKGRSHKETLHLALVTPQCSQGHTAGSLSSRKRQQQSTAWWRIRTRQTRALCGEALKRQIYLQSRGIFLEQRAHAGNLRRRDGSADSHKALNDLVSWTKLSAR